MAVEILSILAMSAECERLFSSGGLMVSPFRSQLEALTVDLVQTLRSWLKGGIIRDSVMDVADLGSETDSAGSMSVTASIFIEYLEGEGKTLTLPLQDGDQVKTMDN